MDSQLPSGSICDPHEMLRLVRAGDIEALEQITRCYGERLLTVGRRYCGNDDRARDAVQDALLAAGRSLDSFRGDGTVEAWLVRMVANACSRMRRGRKNDPQLHDTYDEQRGAMIEDGSPEAAAMKAQLAGALGDAMLRLAPRDRALLLLADAEGWKGPELADALNLTPTAVRSRLSRARSKLRAELEPLWEDWSTK